jgi:FMN reductase
VVKAVALLGSVTPPGRLSSAISSALSRLEDSGHEATLLDLGVLSVGYADGRSLAQLTDDTAELVRLVSGADAVVLASPIYRASMTGALKNALDLLPLEALRGKPTAIVTMGATLHHYLGAESHLRDVLAWFGALTLPTAVYLSSADFQDGVLTETAAGQLDALMSSATDLAVATQTLRLGPSPLSAATSKKG